MNLQRQIVNGVYEAADGNDLSSRLAEQKLYLIEYKPYSELAALFGGSGYGRVPMREFTSFCRQFSVMLKARIPIPECLYILKNHSQSQKLKQTLSTVYDDIKSGYLLSKAFGRQRQAFPAFFVNMIKIGEVSEKLDTVLLSLADYYDKDAALRRRINGAVSYPVMLTVMTAAILVLMLGFVIPTLRTAMETLGVEIVGFTKLVYDVSDFLVDNRWRMPAVAIVFFLILFLIFRSERGRYCFDVIKLKLPILGRIHLYTVTTRFSRGFGLLLSSGMDLDEAMKFACAMIENRRIKKRFMMAADSVCRGMPLSSAFEVYDLFTPELIQMVTVGERTASLGDVFMRAADFFDAELDASLNSFVSKLQPTMLIALGIIIGAVFFAVYSPMLSIINGLI